ncbi:MAG: U32 family peptidase [bacterium]
MSALPTGEHSAAAADRRPELLAPAGDREALKAALLAGADAVYLAGLRYGARASAANFDGEGLAWARRVTRALDRRLYVAVNTLVEDSQWDDLEAYLGYLVALEVDAVIVQDLGVLTTLRRVEKALGIAADRRLPAHLSTQAAWDGAGGERGAAALRALGVTRVVLPRETPLATIEELCADGPGPGPGPGLSPFEVEVFVHGAHCYSVSGRCWWSAALGPRSGNRGTCAQPCRRSYEARDMPRGTVADAPWLSPRDLRLLDRVPALVSAGVTSLKIEGRLKDAKYVSEVTRTYRAALGAAPGKTGHSDLDRVFGREWIRGFLDAPPRDWNTVASVGSAGEEVGVVSSLDAGDGLVRLSVLRDIAPGDGLVWDAATGAAGAGAAGATGAAGGALPSARVTWIDGGVGSRLVRLRGDRPHRVGLTLRRTDRGRPADPLAGWDPAWEDRTVTLRFSGRAAEPLTVEAAHERRTVRCASLSTLEPARGQGLETLLQERFGQFGDGFRAVELDTANLSPGLFLPPKALKALRRDLDVALRQTLPVPETTSITFAAVSPGARRSRSHSLPHLQPTTWIRLWRRSDLAPLSDLQPTGGWILPAEDASLAEDSAPGRPVRYWLPPLFGPDAAERLAPLVARLPSDELLCFSWEAFALAARFPERRFRLDWTFNVSNTRAAEWLARQDIGVTCAPEATRPIPGAVALWRINPLVSLSRFPPAADAPSRFVNPHGDHFHRQALHTGCWGLFLEQLPNAPDATRHDPGATVQVDVFLPRRSPQNVDAVRAAILTLPGVVP